MQAAALWLSNKRTALYGRQWRMTRSGQTHISAVHTLDTSGYGHCYQVWNCGVSTLTFNTSTLNQFASSQLQHQIYIKNFYNEIQTWAINSSRQQQARFSIDECQKYAGPHTYGQGIDDMSVINSKTISTIWKQNSNPRYMIFTCEIYWTIKS